MSDPMYPVIHLNGTSAEELMAQLEDAVSALRAALRAMEGAEPNGRDYLDPSFYKIARAEHVARLGLVQGVKQELGRIYAAVSDAADARAARRRGR
jgi:hypothetical protein